jgi:transcriptional regulator with XRE-family HTH domain
MSSEYNELVAAEVRAEMARRRITQEALAAHLHTTQRGISRRLTGEVAFNLDELSRIAEFLDVPVTRLVAVAA